MNASFSSTPANGCVLVLALDEATLAPVREAATLIDAHLEIVVDEAAALARVASGDVDAVFVGAAAPSGDATMNPHAVALRIAEAAAAPTVLLLSDAKLDRDLALALARQGVDVLEPPLDSTTVACRLALDLHVRARSCAQRGQAARADALLRLNESLIGGLVHDLRTPLMAINLSAEVAGARSADESVQQAVRRMRSSTQRMARTLEHLSNIAHADASGTLPELGESDLGELATRAVEAVRASDPGAHIELKAQGDLRLRADGTALQAAIARILQLVMQPANGELVTVRVDGSGRDRVLLEVASAHVIAVSAHGAEAVVRAHAGSIVVRSKAPEGTVFELLLPRDPG